MQTREPDPFARLHDPEPPTNSDGHPPELSDLEGRLQPGNSRPALLGARHDVQLQPRATPTCSCMAFASGAPSDPRFAWEEEPPLLTGTDSTVIGFAMVEGECANEIIASYRGYELSGADVHILLETAVEGRPLLTGAVVPMPQPGGRFVVVPPKDAPFGKSRVAGETRCLFSAIDEPPTTKAKSSTNPIDDVSSDAMTRAKPRPADGDTDLPTSEEFDSTPNEIPLDDGEHSWRDGFHLSFVLGLEYPIGRAHVGSGLSPSSISALGGAFDVFIGGNQRPGMAVGLTMGGASAPNPSLDFGASQTEDAQNLANQSGWELRDGSLVLNGTQMNLFRIGAFVDYYFSDDTNWHGLLTLGYASMSFSGNAMSDTAHGFAMQAGLGYDFWLSYHWSLGLLGRLMWSPMSADSIEDVVHVWSPNLGLTVTFH